MSPCRSIWKSVLLQEYSCCVCAVGETKQANFRPPWWYEKWCVWCPRFDLRLVFIVEQKKPCYENRSIVDVGSLGRLLIRRRKFGCSNSTELQDFDWTFKMLFTMRSSVTYISIYGSTICSKVVRGFITEKLLKVMKTVTSVWIWW